MNHNQHPSAEDALQACDLLASLNALVDLHPDHPLAKSALEFTLHSLIVQTYLTDFAKRVVAGKSADEAILEAVRGNIPLSEEAIAAGAAAKRRSLN